MLFLLLFHKNSLFLQPIYILLPINFNRIRNSFLLNNIENYLRKK